MNFENLVNDSVIYLLINEYLSISDIKKVLFLNKKIYRNKSNRYYTRILLEEIASNKITVLMKSYLNKVRIITHNNYDYLFSSQLITSRYCAFYYFKYYHKNYINGWYNNNIDWKGAIIKRYKKKHTNDPTRYDLFNLIKYLDPYDTIAIGW